MTATTPDPMPHAWPFHSRSPVTLSVDALRELTFLHGCREFRRRQDGMIHAMEGGLWLHRHVWKGTPMVHLVSTDRVRLLAYGDAVGLPSSRLQFKPLKDPRTGARRDAWHWDLVGARYPVHDARLFETGPRSPGV